MIFIDTSYLVALAVRSDGLHRTAMAWSAAAPGPFLTTEFVLLEFVNALSSAALRPRAHRMTERLRANPSVRIEPASSELLRSATDLHKARSDKEWSLTDCTSFIVMQRHSASDALTHDQDFEQAGFRALLRAEPRG
jgi:uncharacterized protein